MVPETDIIVWHAAPDFDPKPVLNVIFVKSILCCTNLKKFVHTVPKFTKEKDIWPVTYVQVMGFAVVAKYLFDLKIPPKKKTWNQNDLINNDSRFVDSGAWKYKIREMYGLQRWNNTEQNAEASQRGSFGGAPNI